ncbi:MAG TPA: hypothetical protein VEO96_08675 [Thermoplasmata archaeon]|nr:hypothetical protein [Thermoplasmata archaeon]
MPVSEDSIRRVWSDPHESHKLYTSKYILDKLYLDSCTVIDALLGPTIQATGAEALSRAREATLAKRIVQEWLPSHLIISPYVIGEFLEVAIHKYSKTEADAQKMLADFIRPGADVKYAELDLGLANIYDAIGADPSVLLSVELKGPATGEDGHRYSTAEGGFRLYRSGHVVKFANVSGPVGASLPELQFDASATQTVSAPAYELALFHKVANLRVDTGVNWKDAFHYLYANWGNAQVILTTNKRDFEKVEGYQFPRVLTPSEYEAELKSRHLELHNRIFGDEG